MFLNESSAEQIETGSRPSTSSCMGARNLFSVKRHPPPRPRPHPLPPRKGATSERAKEGSVSHKSHPLFTRSTLLMEGRQEGENHDPKIIPGSHPEAWPRSHSCGINFALRNRGIIFTIILHCHFISLLQTFHASNLNCSNYVGF